MVILELSAGWKPKSQSKGESVKIQSRKEFDLTPLSSGIGLLIPLDSPMASPNNRVDQPERKRLASIGGDMCESGQPGSSLSILFDGNDMYQVKAGLERFPPIGLDISMTELLVGQRRLSFKHRLILATILANALLDVGDSAWLDENWNKRDISFFENAQTKEWCLDRPFITANFAGSKPMGDVQSLLRIHPKPSILNLGIVLLEIQLWTPIEEWRAPEDLKDGLPNENTDLTTALRLIDEIHDEVSRNYRNAIEACLDHNLVTDYSDVSLEDTSLRQTFLNRVVAPLENDLSHLFSKPTWMSLDDMGSWFRYLGILPSIDGSA